MARVFMDGIELDGSNDLSISKIDSKSDLNVVTTRIVKTNGSAPKNAPTDIDKNWAIYITLEIDAETRCQFAFDSTGNIRFRGRGGSTHGYVWTNWKKII